MSEFHRAFEKYKRKMLGERLKYEGKVPEDEYIVDFDLRKNLNSQEKGSIVLRIAFLILGGVVILSMVLLLNRYSESLGFSFEVKVFLIPFCYIGTALYFVILIPLLAMRKYRKLSNFCSKCGKPLRVVARFGATNYYCDTCRLKLSIDQPDYIPSD